MNPKRRFFQIHLSTAVVLMLVAATVLAETGAELDALVVEHNAASGYFPFAQGIRTPAVAWKIQLPNPDEHLGFVVRPVVFNGTLYAISTHRSGFRQGAQSTVYAVEAATGKKLWSKALKEFASGENAFTAGNLYVSVNGGVLALSLRDGSEVWRWKSDLEYEKPFRGRPVLLDGKLLIAHNDEVRAFEPLTGKELWKKPFANLDYFSAAGRDKTIIGGAESSPSKADACIGLNVTTGGKPWETTVPHRLFQFHFALGSGVAAGGFNQFAHGFSIEKGKELWKRDFGDRYAVTAPAVGNGKVFYGVDSIGDTNLVALDALKGTQLWSTPVDNTYYITVTRDSVLMTYYDTLWGFDEKTGAELFKFRPGKEGEQLGPPACDKDHVFVGTPDGMIYCMTDKRKNE